MTKSNEAEINKMQPTHLTTYQIGNESYTFSTSFESVTFSKYVRWLNEWVSKFPTEEQTLTGEHEAFTDLEYGIKILSFQTGIPIEILKDIDMAYLNEIALTQGFWYDPNNIEVLNIVDKEIVGSVSLEDAAAKHLIAFVQDVTALNGNHVLTVMPDAIKGYFNIDISEMKLGEGIGTGTVYGLATFFLFKLANTGLKSNQLFTLPIPTAMKLKQVLAYSRNTV